MRILPIHQIVQNIVAKLPANIREQVRNTIENELLAITWNQQCITQTFQNAEYHNGSPKDESQIMAYPDGTATYYEFLVNRYKHNTATPEQKEWLQAYLYYYIQAPIFRNNIYKNLLTLYPDFYTKTFDEQLALCVDIGLDVFDDLA